MPENTIPAFIEALKLGVNTLEPIRTCWTKSIIKLRFKELVVCRHNGNKRKGHHGYDQQSSHKPPPIGTHEPNAKSTKETY